MALPTHWINMTRCIIVPRSYKVGQTFTYKGIEYKIVHLYNMPWCSYTSNAYCSEVESNE